MPAAPVAGDGVPRRGCWIVAEQTGYPPDLLDMDLDLEADLGIDTVKQAEVFAAIRERVSGSSVTIRCRCATSRRWTT